MSNDYQKLKSDLIAALDKQVGLDEQSRAQAKEAEKKRDEVCVSIIQGFLVVLLVSLLIVLITDYFGYPFPG